MGPPHVVLPCRRSSRASYFRGVLFAGCSCRCLTSPSPFLCFSQKSRKCSPQAAEGRIVHNERTSGLGRAGKAHRRPVRRRWLCVTSRKPRRRSQAPRRASVGPVHRPPGHDRPPTSSRANMTMGPARTAASCSKDVTGTCGRGNVHGDRSGRLFMLW